MNDAEKLRLKRLAKIAKSGSHQSTSSENQVSTRNDDPTPPPAKTVTIKNTTTTTATIASSIPERKEALPPSIQEAKSQKPASQGSNAKLSDEQVASWYDSTFTHVLKCTLVKDRAVKSTDNVVYLKSLFAELESEEPVSTPKPYKITPALLDRVLVSRLTIDPDEMTDDDDTLLAISALPQTSTFKYLLDCWRRAQDVRKNLRLRFRNQEQLAERQSELENAKALLVSYAGLILSMPDMFPQPKEFRDQGAEQLVPLILAEPDTSEGLPSLFLDELSARFEGDGLEDIIGPLAIGISSNMRDKSVFKDWQTPMRALTDLVRIKAIAACLPKSASWNPSNMTPRAMELASIMGPFCRLHVFPVDFPDIALQYFSNAEQRVQTDLLSSINSLRGTLNVVQPNLFAIFNQIVRSNPSAREATLQYWADNLKLNKKRGGLQVDPLTVSSDSFMVNLAMVILHFANPFIDLQCSKIDKVDMDYFSKSNRLDLQEETKIKATTEEAAEFYKINETAPSSPNFISDIFYLAMAYLHFGPIAVISGYEDGLRSLQEMKQQYERLKAQQPSWAGTPLAAQSDNLLERLRVEIDKQTSNQYAMDAILLDPSFLNQIMSFYNFAISWLLRLLDPEHNHPHQRIQLPLPEEPAHPLFSMLPEFFIEDICEFYIFIGKNDSQNVLGSYPKDDLVIFITTILINSGYVKNPYLKAKLVEILFYNILSYRTGHDGPLKGVLNSLPFAEQHLMPALMSFYSQVEQTGASSQFYDKFNIRYNISQIFWSVWDNEAHRERLRIEARSHMDDFVRFVNLMMNDATYLLDEALTKMTEIRNYQREMADADRWNALSQQERQERESFLRQSERQAQSYNALGNETVRMLKAFTKELPTPFMEPEIVSRLAAMLDYNLNVMTGPKCQDLKVDNMEKYRFNPKRLLGDLIDIYLNLSTRKEFVEAVAREGRSYSKELFQRTATIALRRSIKSEDEVKKLQEFVEHVEEIRRNDAAGEEELGEVPEEFLDPLLYTLMQDPVTLPSSNVTMDRSSIKSCLLSDPIDPFNRSPLKIEDVISNTELKGKIDTWLESRRGKKA